MKSRDPDKMEPLAAAIYRRMQDRGLTQKRLALQAGLSDTYVRDLFDGKKRSPTLGGLQAIARVLGCTVGALLGEQPGDVRSEAERAALRDRLYTVIVVNLAMLVDEGLLEADGRGVEDMALALSQTIEEYVFGHAAAAPVDDAARRAHNVVDITRARLARGG